jgi:hypothetical protein
VISPLVRTCPDPQAGASGLAAQAAQFVSQHPQGTVEMDVLVNTSHGAGSGGSAVRVSTVQAATRHVFLNLCGDAAYVEQLNRPRISLVFLAQHLHITFRFALALRSLIYFER